MSQIAEFHAAVLQNLPELTPAEMQEWIGPSRSTLRSGLMFLKFLKPDHDLSLLTVPAHLSYAERIARGCYDWKDSNITEEKFPVTVDQVGEFEWKLFHFDPNQIVSFDEVIKLMRTEGFEPGAIGHILTFGEKYPEKQQEYSIIALGSTVENGSFWIIPGLWSDGGRRKLGLKWNSDGWWGTMYWHFLGVRRCSRA